METPETIRTSLRTGDWVPPYISKTRTSTYLFKVSPGSICVFTSLSVLPVQSSSIWSVHSTHGVHSSGERGQTACFIKGYSDRPVPRPLVGQTQMPPNLSLAYTDTYSSLPGIRVAGQQGEIRTGSQTGIRLRRLPVWLERGKGQIHPRALADLNKKDLSFIDRSGLPGLAAHVPHRVTHSNREAPRSSPHEAHTVAPEKELEGH